MPGRLFSPDGVDEMKPRLFVIGLLVSFIFAGSISPANAALTCGLSFQQDGGYIVVKAIAQNHAATTVNYSMRVTVRSGGNSSQSVQGGKADISGPGQDTVLSRSVFGGNGETNISADLLVQSGEQRARCQANSDAE